MSSDSATTRESISRVPSGIKAPFPYFGGKAKIAPMVWSRLGDVAHYVEPFFGSGAVLLARPHRPNTETINDADGFVANFWRAVQAEPDAVADGMNWPVNEVDLEARHRWLCTMPDKEEFLDRMKHDPEHYDVKRAAWWCWGLAAWIGSGWCGGEYYPDAPGRSHGTGVVAGANKRPHLGDGGLGVHRQCPHLGNGGNGETARRGEVLLMWMQQIADRMRNVRVCCGDWARICTDGATAYGSTVGVFLDPPYSAEALRDDDIYRCEDLGVAHAVRDWCIARTADPRYRIVLAGYEGEHNDLEAHGWSVVSWKANGGMAHVAKNTDTQGRANAHRERLWCSPSCGSDGRDTLWQIFGTEADE